MRDTRPIARATIYVERDGIDDIPVNLEGRYSAGRRGRKAHPMDRFAEPDEPDEMEVTEAKWGEFAMTKITTPGEDADLTDAETKQAEEALWEAANDDVSNAQESAAEARAERRLERGREEA